MGNSHLSQLDIPQSWLRLWVLLLRSLVSTYAVDPWEPGVQTCFLIESKPNLYIASEKEKEMRYTTILSAAVLSSAWPVSGSLWGQSPFGGPSLPARGGPVPGESERVWHSKTRQCDYFPEPSTPVSTLPLTKNKEEKVNRKGLAQADTGPLSFHPTPRAKHYRGEKLKITASGETNEAIMKGAYVNVDVRYGFVKLLQKQIDLYENAGEIDLSRPVELSVMKEVDLPKAIPPVSSQHIFAGLTIYIYISRSIPFWV